MAKKDVAEEYQDFAYVVSHDLRAPLRQMNGFISILFEELEESGVQLNEDQKGYKDMVLNSIERAEGLLSVLLEFSRYNTVPLNDDDANIKCIVEEAITQVKDIRDGDVEISNFSEITIKGDKNLLIKAFVFLLDNAMKFQPEEQKAKVLIGGALQDDCFVVTIQDNGIGMDPALLKQAFTILRKANNAYDGRGVGLTFAKKIIELHHGEINIDTAEEQGTTLRVSLPC